MGIHRDDTDDTELYHTCTMDDKRKNTRKYFLELDYI